MSVFRCQFTAPMVSGIPADVSTNTWHFNGADYTAVTPGITLALSFYSSIVSLYPATVAQNVWRLKVYNLDDPTPRAPIVDTTFNLTTAPTGDPLPHECAMVLSWQAARQSGQSQASRRNRIYIGPLDKTLVGTNGLFTTTATDTLRDAAQVILTASDAAAGWSWVVNSSNGGPFEIDNGWVDNAVDTQRRRGVKATLRDTFT